MSARSSSLSSEQRIELMAYVDGELEGAERSKVEGWLASNVDAARFVDELGVLGDRVRLGHEASNDAKAVASFDVADAVMAAVESETANAAPAPVVSLEARRQKNLKAGATLVAALALAASVFVMVRSKDEEAPMARAPVPTVQPPGVTSAEPGIDVDLVETAGDSVGVFYLASESSPTTSVVVWVDESGGK